MRQVGVIDEVVEVVKWFDRDGDAFVFCESQRLCRVEDAALINCFDAGGHDFSLDDLWQEFLWV